MEIFIMVSSDVFSNNFSDEFPCLLLISSKFTNVHESGHGYIMLQYNWKIEVPQTQNCHANNLAKYSICFLSQNDIAISNQFYFYNDYEMTDILISSVHNWYPFLPNITSTQTKMAYSA